MIQHMVLVGDQLYVSELYGEWSVRCYDIANERPAASWKPIVEREQHPLALSANHDYLAIGSGTSINIYDLASHKAVARIDVDYAVKRVEFAWNDANQLAVRLDSGLISLYQVF